jgi:hypothetical protein
MAFDLVDYRLLRISEMVTVSVNLPPAKVAQVDDYRALVFTWSSAPFDLSS